MQPLQPEALGNCNHGRLAHAARLGEADPRAVLSVLQQLTAAAERHGAMWGRMGSACQLPKQVTALLKMGQRRDDERLERICEIGFNAGHSAALLLHHNNASLIEFDLHNLTYSAANVALFESMYPGRLSLRKGDSTLTVAQFVEEALARQAAAQPPCDRFFIDGNHQNPTVAIDFANAMRATRSGGLVMADDTTARFADVLSEWTALVRRGLLTSPTCQSYTLPRPAGLKGFCWGERTARPADDARGRRRQRPSRT